MTCKCDTITAGMLSELISIERAANTPDGTGGFTEVWGQIPDAPTRAYVKASSGSERWASGRTEAVSKYKATVRYFDGLFETDSVIIRQRRYNIRFVDNLEMQNRWLELTLDLGVAV